MHLQAIRGHLRETPGFQISVAVSMASIGLALIAVGSAALGGQQGWARWPRVVPAVLVSVGSVLALGGVCCCLRQPTHGQRAAMAPALASLEEGEQKARIGASPG